MSSFDSLNDTFDITPVEGEAKPIKRSKPLNVSNKEEDRAKDYQYARAQLYDIVDRMQESLANAMEVAEESGHPRAYEVVFNGAKHAADVVDKLQDLHVKEKRLEEESNKPAVANQTQNNIFMSGSTADLLKALKENK